MEVYIFKSVACLALFFFFYKLVLENSTLHTIKRFYLLGSLIASVTIPFITFTEIVEVTPLSITTLTTEMPDFSNEEPLEIATPVNYLPYLLWTVYCVGATLFLVRFIRNTYRLIKKVHENTSIKKQSILYVLLHLPVTPHSFFNYIFFNKKAYEEGSIPEEVIIHERAHVLQKHSWDILCIELFRIVFWFNPMLYFLKNSIKLNHEFLADKAVLKKGAELTTYQNILLDFSSTSSVPPMAHAINYSSIKKRFTVMKTHTTKKAAWLKGLLLLPLLAVTIYGFSSTETVTKTASDYEVSASNTNLVTENFSGEKATPEQVVAYNKMATYWNERFAENPTDRTMPLSELKKIESIYRIMSFEQRETAAPFPHCSLEQEGYKSAVPTARSIEIQITGKGTYLVDGQPATKSNLAKTVGKLHQDLTPSIRNHMMNIHITYPKDPSREEVQFIFDALYYYGFYRLVAGNQEVVRGKGNTPMKSEVTSSLSNQDSWEKKYAKEFNEGAKRNKKKSIVITINASEVMINGKRTTIKNFARDIDRATKDWEETDYTEAYPSVLIASTPKSFLNKLEIEFKKTNFSKANGGMSLIPPPPPPPSPEDPTTNKGSNSENVPLPPPPPPAPDMEKLAKQGATFYYEGKKISSKEAIQLVKKDKDLNIQVKKNKNSSPTVIIQKAPFHLKKSTGNTPQINIKTKNLTLKTGNIKINGEDYFYTTKNGVTNYYDRFGNAVDKNGNAKTPESQKSPTFYLDGKQISASKANRLLENNSSFAVTTKDYSDNEYAVHLTNLNKNNSNWNNVNYNAKNNHNATNNPNSVIDLTEVISKGATFYLNDKKISTEKAKYLAEHTDKIARVNVKNQKNGPPNVYFWTK